MTHALCRTQSPGQGSTQWSVYHRGTFKAGLHFLTLLPIEHSTRSLPWTWTGNTAGAGPCDSQGLELCHGSLTVVPVALGHLLRGCCHVSPARQRPREEEKSPWAFSPTTAEPSCTNPPRLLTAGEKETLSGEFSLFVKWARAEEFKSNRAFIYVNRKNDLRQFYKQYWSGDQQPFQNRIYYHTTAGSKRRHRLMFKHQTRAEENLHSTHLVFSSTKCQGRGAWVAKRV